MWTQAYLTVTWRDVLSLHDLQFLESYLEKQCKGMSFHR